MKASRQATASLQRVAHPKPRLPVVSSDELPVEHKLVVGIEERGDEGKSYVDEKDHVDHVVDYHRKDIELARVWLIPVKALLVVPVVAYDQNDKDHVVHGQSYDDTVPHFFEGAIRREHFVIGLSTSRCQGSEGMVSVSVTSHGRRRSTRLCPDGVYVRSDSSFRFCAMSGSYPKMPSDLLFHIAVKVFIWVHMGGALEKG